MFNQIYTGKNYMIIGNANAKANPYAPTYQPYHDNPVIPVQGSYAELHIDLQSWITATSTTPPAKAPFIRKYKYESDEMFQKVNSL